MRWDRLLDSYIDEYRPRDPTSARHSGSHSSIVFMWRFPLMKSKKQQSWCSSPSREADFKKKVEISAACAQALASR
jgi:hypothetical protein